MEFTTIKSDKPIKQSGAVNDANGNAVVHNRYRMKFGILHHQLEHILTGCQ